ncbi:hypothetical protein BGZ74_003848 [Mortierella antarctica]|nr:hypothetical protein BGZ74_003848 [Mortierella antarctica]
MTLNPELITQDPPQTEPVESSDLNTPLQTRYRILDKEALRRYDKDKNGYIFSIQHFVVIIAACIKYLLRVTINIIHPSTHD